MRPLLPNEIAVMREMAETGLDEMQAIRRIQQRRVLIRKIEKERRAAR